jgi:hypothetical protein
LHSTISLASDFSLVIDSLRKFALPSGRFLSPVLTALQYPQKLTLNMVSHAGQVMSRSPGRLVIRILLSHEGHRTSAFGTLAVIRNWLSQVEHCRLAGRRSTPEISTELQDGQATFSSAQARLVTGCSTRTLASHNRQEISPNSGGRRPSHFGHDRSGGAIADSTVNSSSMSSPRVVPVHLRFAPSLSAVAISERCRRGRK